MQPLEHQRYEDELAAYLLGALTDDEARAFEAHLGGCELCQGRERWLRTSVDVLPASVEQVEPPPELRERLIDTVRREAGTSGEAGARAPSRPPARRGWARRLGSLGLRPAIGLAALMIVAGGLVGYALRGGEGGTETKTIKVQSLGAPAVRATLVRTGDRGILRVASLSPRKNGVYEVWLVQRGQPKPSTLFQVRPDGTGAAAIPDGLDRSTQVLVTFEPPGGSERPTSKPFLSAKV